MSIILKVFELVPNSAINKCGFVVTEITNV